MQLDAQAFLRLCERAKTIGFVDIEATGLKGDYNSVLCVSVRPFESQPTTYSIIRPGIDQKVVREAKDALESLDCWVTYFGKGFDLPMLNTRLLRWGVKPITKRPHLDMYWTLKSHLNTARRSQGHLLSWLGIKTMPDRNPETGVLEVEVTDPNAPQKMTVSAEMWNLVLAYPRRYMPTMISRCESDVEGLESLYKRTKHLVGNVTL